jgi:Kdo2-lipid IVA lauroyltransferase/acyltransferase
MSDGLYFVLYNIVGYRKAVVFNNLKNSFPEKSTTEIEEIARKSYRNLADLILEGIKGFSMSDDALKKRYIFKNPEIINNNTEAGGNSIVMTGHYGNWEWGVLTLPIYVKKLVVGFYKPLANTYIDAYARKKHGINGLDLVPINETSEGFERNKKKQASYFFVSDQSTSSKQGHWVHFLNQDTICPYGGDKYARLYDYPVYYLEINRISRGNYALYFEKLTENASKLPEQEVTKIFMARLEKQILEKPEDWLWSHKRWKHKRQV